MLIAFRLTAVSLTSHLILESLNKDFVHVEFYSGFRFAGTHVAVWIGTIQCTRYQELFPGVWLLVQENLRERRETGRERGEDGLVGLIKQGD